MKNRRHDDVHFPLLGTGRRARRGKGSPLLFAHIGAEDMPLLAFYRMKCKSVTSLNPHYSVAQVREHALELTEREHQRRQAVEDAKPRHVNSLTT